MMMMVIIGYVMMIILLDFIKDNLNIFLFFRYFVLAIGILYCLLLMGGWRINCEGCLRMVGSQPDGYWSWLIGCGLLVKIFN
jgi:hypothetical protein